MFVVLSGRLLLALDMTVFPEYERPGPDGKAVLADRSKSAQDSVYTGPGTADSGQPRTVIENLPAWIRNYSRPGITDRSPGNRKPKPVVQREDFASVLTPGD